MRRNIPNADAFVGKTLSRFPNHVILEAVGKGANGRVFRAHDAITESTLAFKVVPVTNLPGYGAEREAYLNEAKTPNIVQHPSVVRYLDVFACDEIHTDVPCIVFVREYINGTSLQKYLKENGQDVSVPLLETFLRTMFELLYELQERNIDHGDLHIGNVIVEDPQFNVYGRARFRVTDFGVRDLAGEPDHANDYLSVGRILEELLQVVSYTTCTGRDRYVFNVLRQEFRGRHLLEIDQSIDPLACNPRALLDKLGGLDDEHRRATRNPRRRLQSPFDYPNCEQIGNSHLLLESLYSDRLLGLSEIEQRSNLILTGPRGCGKTTVFRALSLDYLTATDKDDPDAVAYIGVYYRCDDLYFAFPRYENPERKEALDIPIHFLVVTLVACALEQIGAWATRRFPREFVEQEGRLVRDLWDLFGWAPPNNPSADQLGTLLNRLRVKERRRATLKQRFARVESEPIEGYFGPAMIFAVAQLIRDRLSFLEDRPFYFFIDDYSDPKITKDLQRNLNRMVMHRSADVFFKLSTESPISFAREDVDGKQFVESREYDLVNLGLRYIRSGGGQTLEFLEDLFSRRFKEVPGYPVSSLYELLGETSVSENERARAFRQKKGRDSYAGTRTVGAMCSGDIHYIIRLVGSMVEDYGGRDGLERSQVTPKIDPKKQHESIRSAAGAFMQAVRTLPRCGQQLADIVSAFGGVAYSFMQHRHSTNQQGKPPHQATRIEPFEGLRLGTDAQHLLEELLRYSILIEDPRGKSRRGNIVPRFYLRRYLIPHFQLTFSRRDSLELENEQLELLLCEPKRFENERRLRQDHYVDDEEGLRMRPKGLFDDAVTG